MDWWKEKRRTYEITVTVRLTIRASAILVAPWGSILFLSNLREGDENEQRGGRKGGMDWWKERRGTYPITVTVRLNLRASAILVAPWGPILFRDNLREGDENERRDGKKEKERWIGGKRGEELTESLSLCG
jgi:hypothetical protein